MSAAAAAAAEAASWAEIAARWEPAHHPAVWADRPATEAAVVVFHDPAGDLARRVRRWGHDLPGLDLAALARFAAGLALAEAEAWENDDPVVATRAYEERRFLLGDRVLHWAVPWLDTVGRCHPGEREAALADRDRLLDFGERHRPAPDLAGPEGTAPPGEDTYGPLHLDVPLAAWSRSLWSGALILDRTLESMTGRMASRARLTDAGFRTDLSGVYEIAAARWRRLAADRAGSAALWRDLGARAALTAARLG